MKRREIVGFSCFSLYEMGDFWKEIELFQFEEAYYYEFVDIACIYLKPQLEDARKAMQVIRETFFGRYQQTESADKLILSDRLFLTLAISDSEAVLMLQPTRPRRWESADFDIVREVDGALRPLKLPVVSVQLPRRVFYHGKVLSPEQRKIEENDDVKKELVKKLIRAGIERFADDMKTWDKKQFHGLINPRGEVNELDDVPVREAINELHQERFIEFVGQDAVYIRVPDWRESNEQS